MSTAAAAKSLQSCLTLCDPIDGSPPGPPYPWDSPGKSTGVGCHFLLQSMKVKSESEVAQSCLTPHDWMDCSPPGSSVHGIFQARVLEWGAIAFSTPISKNDFNLESWMTRFYGFSPPFLCHEWTSCIRISCGCLFKIQMFEPQSIPSEL